MPFEVTPVTYTFGSRPLTETLEQLRQKLEDQYNLVAKAGGQIVASYHVELDPKLKAHLLVAEYPEPEAESSIS